MSRDFSPRDHWLAEQQFNGLHFSNFIMHINGKEIPMFTDKELEDRKKHPHLAVLGADIYKPIREYLSDKEFEIFDNTLKHLIEADLENHDTSQFPKTLTDWYFNRYNHYYHEPNDAMLLVYIESTYQKGKIRAE